MVGLFSNGTQQCNPGLHLKLHYDVINNVPIASLMVISFQICLINVIGGVVCPCPKAQVNMEF